MDLRRLHRLQILIQILNLFLQSQTDQANQTPSMNTGRLVRIIKNFQRAVLAFIHKCRMTDERNALLLNLHDVRQLAEVPFRNLILQIFRNFTVLRGNVLERFAGFRTEFAS